MRVKNKLKNYNNVFKEKVKLPPKFCSCDEGVKHFFFKFRNKNAINSIVRFNLFFTVIF